MTWHSTSVVCLQGITDQIEAHKGIIDNNNKEFYEMKKQKDALQNDRKSVAWHHHDPNTTQTSSFMFHGF